MFGSPGGVPCTQKVQSHHPPPDSLTTLHDDAILENNAVFCSQFPMILQERKCTRNIPQSFFRSQIVPLIHPFCNPAITNNNNNLCTTLLFQHKRMNQGTTERRHADIVSLKVLWNDPRKSGSCLIQVREGEYIRSYHLNVSGWGSYGAHVVEKMEANSRYFSYDKHMEAIRAIEEFLATVSDGEHKANSEMKLHEIKCTLREAQQIVMASHGGLKIQWEVKSKGWFAEQTRGEVVASVDYDVYTPPNIGQMISDLKRSIQPLRG